MILVTNSCVDLALADTDKYIGELPTKGIYFFEVEQVPRSVTVYWDYNGDKHPDKAFVCPMIDHVSLYDCNNPINFDETGDNTYIFNTCPADLPTAYLTTRECWECKTCMYFLIPDKTFHPFSVSNAFNTKLCNIN
jgi:hypothetical protein|tara:strand:- start:41 stop:448 length:408 start_codon:yes stop_codon:yes gene_type:complete